MNIRRENIDEVNAILFVNVEKADYEKSVSDTLKKYRKEASIPGFRPGKVPQSVIQKRFGKSVLAEEVNKVLSQSLTNYIHENKLAILGEPLPNEEKQKPIDWDKDEDFEFAFDIALAPDVEVALDKRNKFDYYTIKVDEEMVNEQVDGILNQLGTNEPAEKVEENYLVRGDFKQLDEDGNELEDGIKPEGVLISVDMIKDETIKKEFIGKKVGDIITFDPVKAFDNRHEVGHMLNITHEQADDLNSEFKFEIKEVLQFVKAELNEEVYKKVYGDKTEIATEEDFRKRIEEDIANSLKQSSDYKFSLDAKKTLLDKVDVTLPEEFLKRWVKLTNKELTEEQIENEFGNFIEDLKWQVLKESVAKDNELEISEDEEKDFAKKIAKAQFQQYGMNNVPEEQLESFAKMMLEKPEEKQKLDTQLMENKVIDTIKEKVTLKDQEVSRQEFEDMLK